MLNTLWTGRYIIKQLKYIQTNQSCCKCLRISADLRNCPLCSHSELGTHHTLPSPAQACSWPSRRCTYQSAPDAMQHLLLHPATKNEESSSPAKAPAICKELRLLIILLPHQYLPFPVLEFSIVQHNGLLSLVLLLVETCEIDIFLLIKTRWIHTPPKLKQIFLGPPSFRMPPQLFPPWHGHNSQKG